MNLFNSQTSANITNSLLWFYSLCMGKALEQVEKDLLAVVEACAEVALLQLRVLVQLVQRMVCQE